jgi:peptidoglycan/LPS O-acetylase OafA/YrhL
VVATLNGPYQRPPLDRTARRKGNGMAPSEAGFDHRMPGLDALRGIAALGVVVVHSLFMFPIGPSIPSWTGSLVLGVPLFFVISAFALSAAYADALLSRAALCRYGLRRLFRIVPLFYFFLVVWLGYFAYLGSSSRPPAEVLANLTFTFSLVPAMQVSIVPAGWSIGIEMLFYAIFPLLLLNRGITAAVCYLAVSVLLAWSYNSGAGVAVSPYHFWTHPLTNAPYFCFGILIWRLKVALPPHRGLKVARLLLLFAALAGAGMLAFGPAISSAQTQTLPVPLLLILGWGIAFAGLVLSQVLRPELFLVNRATLFLGRISYSLYLSHPFLIYASGLPPLIAGSVAVPALTAPLVVLGVLVLAIPFASALFRAFEMPFIAMGRRLTANGDAS